MESCGTSGVNIGMSQKDDLRSYLADFRRRIRWRDGCLLVQRSFWIALVVAIPIQVAGRLWPLAHLSVWVLAPILLWLVMIMGFVLLQPMSLMVAARRVDAELRLKERLSTALYLKAQMEISLEDREISSQLQAGFQPELVALQQQDALAAARSISPHQAFPLQWNRKSLMLATPLVVAMVVLAVLPNPMDAILAERAALASAIKDQAVQVEKIKDELQKDSNDQVLTPEESQELLRKLEELAQKLRQNPGNQEQALADLSKLEETLRQKLDPNTEWRQAALDALTGRMQDLAEKKGWSNEASSLEQELEKMSEEWTNLSPSEQEALAKSLSQLAAQAAQAGDQNLAQALANLAQSLQAGESTGKPGGDATTNIQAVMQAIAQTEKSLAAQRSLQQALAQLQASRQAIAQAVRNASRSQNPSQAQGPGQSQGAPAGGGGTRADTLPPATGSGNAVQPRGQAQTVAAEKLNSQVYVPVEKIQGNAELFIEGQDTGQGETQVSQQKDSLPGASGQVLVPYHQVYYTYLNTANQAMERSLIPPALKDFVRQYFSQLQP